MTLTLLRTPFLPPTYATFMTPLSINKLDLKSYLYNAYGLRISSVRSYVQQQRVRQDRANARAPAPRRWFRPRSIKKMTVEMASPFAWPDEPTDFAAWDKDMFDRAKRAQEKERDSYRPDAVEKPTGERDSMREQATRLLSGQDTWEPLAPEARVEWEDVGEPVEVETDLKV